MEITGAMAWGFITFLLGLLNLWFWHDKGRDKEDRKAMQDEIDSSKRALWTEVNALKSQQANYMTRPDVKEMMHEALAPIKEEQIKSLSIMRNIESMLRQMEKEFAVTKYALFNRGNNETKSDDN